MYDAQSEPHEFFADTRAAAVAKAVEYFRREENELAVRELGSVSGLGARVAIVAQPSDAVGRAPARSDRDRGDRGDRDRGRDRDRGERGGRDRDRDRDRDRGRGRGGRGEGRERAAEPREREEPAARQPSVGTPRGEVGAVGQFVLGVLERMELGPFEISESEEQNFLVYQLSGPAAQALAAGEGRAADALQVLANQASSQVFEEPKRVVVDAEGNRENREAFLARAAERAAQRARETGRAVALDPMNGKDRRSIHVALRDVEDIATMSIGEGRYRQVLVVPEGAPEYEEARRLAAAAASE